MLIGKVDLKLNTVYTSCDVYINIVLLKINGILSGTRFIKS